MVSAVDSSLHDPHDVLEISPDVVLVARAAADFPPLAPDATGHHDREAHFGAADAATPRVDTTFRATDTSGDRPARGKWLSRAATAFLFAFCSAFAAAGWERYGDEAQAMISGFTPLVTLASFRAWLPTSLIPGRAAVAAPTDTPAPSAAPDQAAQPQPAPAAQADNNAASTAASAAPPADTGQLLQSMARDVASLNQQLSDLKASIAQLKASQDQLAREMVKAPEARVSEARPAEPRPTKLGTPPHPLGTLVTPVHRPKPPSYPPAQAAYVPPPPPPTAAPVQIAPPPPISARQDTDAVVRPPMPVQ